ncbi:Protein hedgehog [Seminavis robusta]|uniref:subtilisin n=1 Tax=Seminavis robusta TaxID=568900 RepID=A0A9N8DFQ5_9STRA|nr:Protein hedgehog [Seminavis robusta]|eukprot:Sro97_g049940.1 Protein hedgehog (933) ;mRNA; r:46189-49162
MEYLLLFQILLVVLCSSIVAVAANEAEFQYDDTVLLQFESSDPNDDVFYNKVKTGEYQKIGMILGGMVDAYVNASGTMEEAKESFPPGASIVITERDTGDLLVQIMLRVAVSTSLAALGFRENHCVPYLCEGFVPLENLLEISGLEDVIFINPITRPKTNTGSVTSEGDSAMYSDAARSRYNVNGAGRLIGVLSDSFSCDINAGTDYATDIETGDLPDDVIVLEDYFGEDCIDEGRAMMQLMYDVAPGARFAFHTAFNGVLDFAQGIRDLANIGCDIIVDDITYFFQPYFQDNAIGRAVDDVVSDGVAYFSAAGNFGRNSWHTDAGFVDSGFSWRGKPLHDFNPSETEVDTVQDMFFEEGLTYRFEFQWDEPFRSVSTGDPPAGSRSDLDVLLVNSDNTVIIESFNFNRDGDAQETIVWEAEYTGRHGLSVILNSGPPPTYMKWISINDAPRSVQYSILSSTIYGHQNAAGTASTGAAFFNNTPRFGVSPARQQPYTSAGGTPVFFRDNGDRLDEPEVRMKPNFVGPDGGLTTFFFPRDDPVFNNRFFGTSGSVSHVAPVAALMLELDPSLTPARIYQFLQDAALDMDDTATPEPDPDFDFGTGHGFVDAITTMDLVFFQRAPTSSPPTTTTSVPTAFPTEEPESPDESPAPTPSPCFSKESTVYVWGKGVTEMRHVKVGDRVLTADSGFEQVYAFGHRDESRVAKFLKIHTTDLNANLKRQHYPALEITEEHLLRVNNTFQPAKGLVVGDVLEGEDGFERVVTRIRIIRKMGLYAPLTPSGTLLVNGIKVSCYVSLQQNLPATVVFKWSWLNSLISQHHLVHMFLTPIRMACTSRVFSEELCDTYSIDKADGYPPFVRLGLDLVQFCEAQTQIVQLLLFMTYLIVFGCLYLVESLIGMVHIPSLVVACVLSLSFVLSRKNRRLPIPKSKLD